MGSKSKEEMAKSLAQSSAPGTIPAKGPGRHLIPNTINISILISIDIHIYIYITPASTSSCEITSKSASALTSAQTRYSSWAASPVCCYRQLINTYCMRNVSKMCFRCQLTWCVLVEHGKIPACASFTTSYARAAGLSFDHSVSEAGALKHARSGHTNLSWKKSPHHHSFAVCLSRIYNAVYHHACSWCIWYESKAAWRWILTHPAQHFMSCRG